MEEGAAARRARPATRRAGLPLRVKANAPVFMPALLAKCKAGYAARCALLPGGRPNIQIVEPKWWKERNKSRRKQGSGRGSGRGRGRGGGAAGGRGAAAAAGGAAVASPRLLEGRIRSALAALRREELLLASYAADRFW